jgi:hypothetical protein
LRSTVLVCIWKNKIFIFLVFEKFYYFVLFCFQWHQRVGDEERAAEGDGKEAAAPEDPGKDFWRKFKQNAIPDQTRRTGKTAWAGSKYFSKFNLIEAT